MKEIYVITEGNSDRDILEAILPERVLQNIQFIVGSGRYSAQSLARSMLAVEQIPVAIITDADTNDNAAIREQRELLHYLLNQASSGTAFQVLLAVPEIEILLVQDETFLKRLADKEQLSSIEIEFAKLHPKRFIRSLSKRKEDYRVMLRNMLRNLDERTIKTIQQHPLVKQLDQFVLSASGI